MAITAVSLGAVFILTAASSQAASGDLDPAFGEDGLVTEPSGQANAVAIQADGKIVAAGRGSGEGGSQFVIARYQRNGTPDPAFGNEGVVTIGFGASDDTATDVAIQPDGKIVAAGTSYRSTGVHFALARFNPDGSLDSGFGSAGELRTSFGVGKNATSSSVAIQSDGKIVLAGGVATYGGESAEYKFALARYSADGTLDTSFGSGGKVTTALAEYSLAQAIALQSDGKIVVGGSAFGDAGSPSTFALARYNADGSLDTAFGTGGKVTTEIGASAYANDLVVQADGMILAGGVALVFGPADELSADFALARYTPNGTLDPSFGSGGRRTTEIGPGDAYINAIAVRPDHKIVAAGSSRGQTSYEFALAQYDQSGSLDPGFGADGTVETDVGSGDGVANDLALQADGKVVAAGSNGQGFMLVRYLAGQAVCVVPKVKGVSLAKAHRAITNAHCSVGTVKRVFSRKVKKGRVTSQEPEPGTRAGEGAHVALVVSKGKRRTPSTTVHHG